MVTVTPILGSGNVKAPMRNFRELTGTVKIVLITNPSVIPDIPDIMRVFLQGLELRTVFTPLQLISVRQRILIECPGFRFAYKGDIAETLQQVLGRNSGYKVLDQLDHPLDLVGLPPESFIVC